MARKAKKPPPTKPPRRAPSKQDVILVLSYATAAAVYKALDDFAPNATLDPVMDEIDSQLSRDDKKTK